MNENVRTFNIFFLFFYFFYSYNFAFQLHQLWINLSYIVRNHVFISRLKDYVDLHNKWFSKGKHFATLKKNERKKPKIDVTLVKNIFGLWTERASELRVLCGDIFPFFVSCRTFLLFFLTFMFPPFIQCISSIIGFTLSSTFCHVTVIRYGCGHFRLLKNQTAPHNRHQLCLYIVLI